MWSCFSFLGHEAWCSYELQRLIVMIGQATNTGKRDYLLSVHLVFTESSYFVGL